MRLAPLTACSLKMAKEEETSSICAWAVSADEKLIEAIHRYSTIWDNRTKAYKDQGAKDNAWAKVAKEVSDSVEAGLAIS